MDIDNGIFLHNVKHFQQPRARVTLFSKEPLLSHFSFGAVSKEASHFTAEPKHILPQGSDQLTVNILKHVRPDKGNPDRVETTLSPDSLKKAFQAWPERTYTLPRGTHLGHYKVWLRDYETREDE